MNLSPTGHDCQVAVLGVASVLLGPMDLRQAIHGSMVGWTVRWSSFCNIFEL